jgi:hypothetical protein
VVLLQILYWKSDAVKTQCWGKEIEEVMVLKGTEAPQRRRRRRRRRKRRREEEEEEEIVWAQTALSLL